MAIEPYGIGRDTVVAKDYKALNDIVQLADVTRPATVRQQVDSLVVDMLNLYLVARAYLRNEVVDKQAYVILSLTQGWHVNLDDTQTMV